MRKILSILLILLSTTSLSFAANELTETQKLAATGKVWGFLKYYHPKVADGKYNWDDQLFDILPKVKKASDKEQLSGILIKWIASLGEIKQCKKCNDATNKKYFDKNFNLDWLSDDKLFNNQLSTILKNIEANRHQGKKHYVQTLPAGNIELKNEENLNNIDWTDEGLRLLTLFRYWNLVEYFFPYKYQTDENWDDVLTQMIPKFLYSRSEMDFHMALLELVVKIDDSHGYFYSDLTKKFFGEKYIPITYQVVDDKAVITGFYNKSLAQQDDLRIGDVVTTVNDCDLYSVFEEKERFIFGSNRNRKIFTSHYALFNGSTDSVTIEINREGKSFSKKVKRYPLQDFYNKQKPRVIHKIMDGNIGYVNMGELGPKDVSDTMEKLMNTRAIIFDTRYYPKWTLYKLSEYITSGKKDFFKVIAPDLDYPGKFFWREGKQCGNNGELIYKGKVILLTSAKSQSQAEFTIMCLQAGDNVITVGSRSSGADGNVSIFEIFGKHKTAFSGIGIFYPDSTETQRNGVKIDVEVNPTIDGVRAGKDEILEKAIEIAKD